MAINMGIGRLGGENLIHKRKFRWTFQIDLANGAFVPASFVKMAARPNLAIEETEINFLNAKTFIPGKGTWEQITITYYDVAVLNGVGNDALWNWLASVYNFIDNIALTQSSRRSCYSGTAKCTMYDGCGQELEEWKLFDCWPTSINFGELDYASTEEATIEVQLRYSNVKFTNRCSPTQPTANCCGCGDSNSNGGTPVS